MNDSDLVRELAREAAVSEDVAGAVLGSLLSLVRQGRVSVAELLMATPPAPTMPAEVSTPEALRADSHAVDDLIARAGRHPLGVDFIVKGFIPSVAAEFGTHAFTVEAAKLRLKREGPSGRSDR